MGFGILSPSKIILVAQSSIAPCFVLGLQPLRKQDDVNGRRAGIFYSARKKTKINTETSDIKNIVGVVLNCLLPSFTLCVLGIWFLPGLRAPSYPYTVGRIKEETGSLNI